MIRRWAAVAALLVAAACAGGGVAADRLAGAAERTADAGTARVFLQQRLSGVGPQRTDVTVSGEGVISLVERRGRLTMTVGETQEYEVILDGGVAYLRLPELGAPTPWVRLDLELLAGVEGAEQLAQLGRVDPAEGLTFLRAALEGAQPKGSEDVRGTPTTRYQVTVDLEAAVAEAPEDSREFLSQQLQRLGTDSLPMDVWVDGDGLVRRQSYTVALPGGAAQPGAPDDVSFTIEYYDFGAAVDVTPPPADQTTDAQRLFPTPAPT